MRVHCPNCNTAIDVNDEPMEELVNPTVTIMQKRLERSSWADIAEMVRAGYAYRLLEIGDTISFKMKNDTDATFEVAAINPYGKNAVVLVMQNCLPDQQCMDEEYTYADSGGWKNCKMRKYLNEEIFPLLPDELQSVITTRKIVQKIDGEEYVSEDKLWLPSQTEMFGDCPSNMDVDDVHFPLYKDERSRVKQIGNSTAWYWLRAPCADSSSCVRLVYYSGDLGYYNASGSSGVAPACVIG